MRTERQERPPVKACPYWACYAEGPNGWVIAYCSYNAYQKMEQSGGVWDGPQRAKRCLFGYNKTAARISPSLIVLNVLSRQEVQVVEVDKMSREAWSKAVEVFLLHVSGWKGTPTEEDLDQLYESMSCDVFNKPSWKDEE